MFPVNICKLFFSRVVPFALHMFWLINKVDMFANTWIFVFTWCICKINFFVLLPDLLIYVLFFPKSNHCSCSIIYLLHFINWVLEYVKGNYSLDVLLLTLSVRPVFNRIMSWIFNINQSHGCFYLRLFEFAPNYNKSAEVLQKFYH